MTDTIQAPVAKAQMLVRRPVAEVYAAFVDPAVTAHFWFTRASGPLRAGAHWSKTGASLSSGMVPTRQHPWNGRSKHKEPR